MIHRKLEDLLSTKLSDKKALILLGARQTGKSTLLEQLLHSVNTPTLFLNGDESDVRGLLKDATSTRLKNLIGDKKLFVIDEAQRVENIGLVIKLIVDQIPGIKVIATGSSAFELANKINEPLTGRKWEYMVYPLSFAEMTSHHGLMEEKRLLEQRLIYGYYPEIVTHPDKAESLLKQLANSYLYKDILVWQKINKPQKLETLLQALALQIGNLVSYKELGDLCGLDNATVENYIRILEQAFIVYRLPALNRNAKSELKRSRKIYFYDNGIRNAVINNFNLLNLRDDKGALWENFIITERLKTLSHKEIFANRFFWRNLQQQEIDYIEERGGIMHATEIKWKQKRAFNLPVSFSETYQHEFNILDTENFEDFLLSPKMNGYI